jgi:serine/threonine protein kinase
MQTENELSFITKGIYEIYPPTNFFYRIEDLDPLIINNKQKIIGEGRFSTVYLYKHKINGTLFALKKISVKKIIESGNDLSIINREINIHSRLNHENIVKFFSYNKGLNEVNILLEYCPNGAIFELINKEGFDEFQTYKYFSQVVNAVYFLHKNNLVHRDIKPENILLNGDKIKLCDFGWCCETNLNDRKSFCGTFEYMAPEIIKEIPYGKPVDIWALGILLYELYFGVSPFNSNKQNEEQTKEIINNIMQNKLFFNRKSIAYDMKDLIIHMLENDVNRRYTIDEVVAHPWFKKCKNKIKDIDSISINKINNINFDEFETNVTKVTKVVKNPTEYWSTSTSMLHKTKSFSLPINYLSNLESPNKNNFYSNKSLKFKNLKNIDMNKSENVIDNNDEEDGFSPFMKNGSINMSVSLNINELPKNNSSFKSNYSSNNAFSNIKTQFKQNLTGNINLYPMDTKSKEIVKGPIKHNNHKSNLINPNRISIVKLKNENINSFPKNTNIKNNQNNQTNSYLPFNKNNSSNNNIINYNFYQINNNRQFNNVFY